jgi:hypothetical protein
MDGDSQDRAALIILRQGFTDNDVSISALGNYMNRGARGNAHGFKISSLTKVSLWDFLGSACGLILNCSSLPRPQFTPFALSF